MVLKPVYLYYHAIMPEVCKYWGKCLRGIVAADQQHHTHIHCSNTDWLKYGMYVELILWEAVAYVSQHSQHSGLPSPCSFFYKNWCFNSLFMSILTCTNRAHFLFYFIFTVQYSLINVLFVLIRFFCFFLISNCSWAYVSLY